MPTKSAIFRLNWRDLIKGIVVAVLTAVFASLEAIIRDKGLGLSLSDLMTIGSVSVLALLGYLSKNLITNKEGKVAGII